jgi:DNA-binding protein Fis
LADVERAHIAKTLNQTFYNQSAAARMLGIDRKQLARKIKKYELPVPRRAKRRLSGV